MCKWGIFLIRRVRALGGKHYALVLGSSSAVSSVIETWDLGQMNGLTQDSLRKSGQKGNGLTQDSLKKSGLMVKRNRKKNPKQATKARARGRKVPLRVVQVGRLNLA